MRFDAALPMHSPETVRSGIATADDDDALALCRNRFTRNRVAGVAFVLLRQIVHRQVDAIEFTAGNRQLAGLLRTHGETDGIELLPQLFARDVFPNRHTGLELDALGLHLFQPSIDDPLFHLEIRDAVTQQATDTIGLLKEGDTMARTRELLRRGPARRSC